MARRGRLRGVHCSVLVRFIRNVVCSVLAGAAACMPRQRQQYCRLLPAARPSVAHMVHHPRCRIGGSPGQPASHHRVMAPTAQGLLSSVRGMADELAAPIAMHASVRPVVVAFVQLAVQSLRACPGTRTALEQLALDDGEGRASRPLPIGPQATCSGARPGQRPATLTDQTRPDVATQGPACPCCVDTSTDRRRTTAAARRTHSTSYSVVGARHACFRAHR